MRPNRSPLAAAVIAVAGLVAFACSKSSEPTGPTSATNVRYKIASPACSGTLPYQFAIDGSTVGSESLQHGDYSRYYGVNAGSHHLVTTISGTAFVRDTTVTVASGTTYTDLVQVFCQ
jgi:hypothetical protein